MKKSVFLLPLAALSLSACGYSVFDAAEDVKNSGGDDFVDGKAIAAQPVTTGSFTKLESSGPDNVIFATGATFQISASGDAETLKQLRYKVENGTIMIGRVNKKYWGNDSKGVTITVTAPALSEASLAGSGDFTADKMTGEKVVLEIAGSGNFSVADVAAKTLESNIAGSGDFKLTGKVDKAEYNVAGSGDIDASKLTATDADIAIAGSGDISVNATGKVDADIAGSGSIIVTGGAKCTSSTMGSGSIQCS